MRSTVLLPALLLALAPLTIGCGSDPAASSQVTPPVVVPAECRDVPSAAPTDDPNGLKPFTSEAELSTYMGEIEAVQKKIAACEAARNASNPGTGMDAGAASPSAPNETNSPPSNEGITNNQEAGADEGGIVKNIGDHLVVLRKGRLFAVNVASAPTTSDSIRVAPTAALNNGVWYDEMLVKGDLVYVVGYRYNLPSGSVAARGATEIDTFRLTAGKLTRIRSMFLESNDYFSGSNYASRMVAGELVFYMPHQIGRQNEALAYPRVLELGTDGAVRAVGPIFGALDVTRSFERSSSPTFHTVVKCTLPADGSLDCHGKAILGSWWREHYVSAGSLYLWSQKHAYRMSLSTQDVTVHAGKGFPRDQFSFKETADALLVAVQDKNGPALTKLPLAAFDKVGGQTPASVSLGLSYLVANRFVGDKLLAAGPTPSTGQAADPYAAELVAVDASTLAVSRIARKSVVRIEPLDGDRALVASDGPNGLVLSALSTNDLTAPATDLAIDGVRQGETRSHGFFFKPHAAGGGTFGYAVTNPSKSGGFGNGISNLGFFSVGADRALGKIGIVSSGNVGGTCETSCVDWYGNTRPIFLRERVFALMGSELAEVSLASGASRVGTAAELKLEPGEAVEAP